MLRSYALYLKQIGRVSEALLLLEVRKDLDPLDVFTLANLQTVLLLSDRTADARAEYERNASLPGIRDIVSEDGIPWLIEQGDAPKVAVAFASATGQVRELAQIWHLPSDALRVLRDALRSPGFHARREFAQLAVFAGYYGDDELAVALLRDAFVGVGYAGFHRLWHPALRDARRTDAFEELMRELGLVELWQQTGQWGDYCRPTGTDGVECT
jgi:hypothetical protein